ncbi:MAG TPA: hypothetical protein VN935_10125 [Rhizomicrobium sp.]|nr:hypothetical protein [Rhizomicrobium sp.]
MDIGFPDMDMGQENSGRGPTYRAALIAVIILSGLFVAGVVALIIGFMRQYQIYQADRRSSVNNIGAGAPPAVVELEPGAHIVSVTTMSNRLILQLDTPKGSEVEVMDLATGKLLFRTATPHP